MDGKLAYAGIRVRDLERSLVFYKKVLGMEEILHGTMVHGGVYVHLKSPGSAQRLELNWYPRGSRFYRPYRNGEDLDHLALWCRDVHRVYRRLVRRGVKIAVEPFREGGYELAFLKDPDGIWIELLGRAMARSPK
jgi:lactoylglutathione lyase